MFQKTGAAAARFGLEGIRQLCEGLGNPQQKFRCIHVAGTNGKGSVCQLLQAVYSANGYLTGGFTSPHLMRYNERITLNAAEIPDAELLTFFQQFGPLIHEVQPSYFELATGIAFWYFARHKADVAIIETGLGGRLDSTNIVSPELSIITSIGLDHTEILGASLSDIAAEKAGIIKRGVPLVAGELPEEALQVVEAVAGRKNSALHYANALMPEYLGEGRVRLRGGALLQETVLKTGFHQAIQRLNIAMVMQATQALQEQFPTTDAITFKAIENAHSRPGFRARFEQLLPGLACYFDGAHNPEAFRHVWTETQKKAGTRQKVLVFSMMRDKFNDEMLSLVSQFDEIYYFSTSMDRGMSFKEIGHVLPNVKRFSDKEWLSLYTRLQHDTDAVSEILPSTIAGRSPLASGHKISQTDIKSDSAAFVLFSGSLHFYSYVSALVRPGSA